MMKQARTKSRVIGAPAPADVPYSLAAGGFLLAIASLCAAFGTSFVEGGFGAEARALFFVLLVAALAAFVRCAANETA